MKVLDLSDDIREKIQKLDMEENFKDTFSNSDFLIIEELDGEIIGIAGVGGLFHIGGIYVKKEFRGKGIAKKLNLERDEELKRRNYSFFIGTTYQQNPNSNEISKILQDRNARATFAFNYYDGFITTIFIQEFNWKGKFLGKLLNFFNSKFGTFCLALLLKLTQKFWSRLFITQSDFYPKINIRYSVINFYKV